MKNIIWICFFAASINLAHADDLNTHDAPYTSLTLAKSSNSWDGSPLPKYPDGTPEIAIVKITIAPGAQLPLHKHDAINAGVLLSGELTVVTETNEVLHMKPGEALIELVGKWHYGKNEGSIPAEIIVFYASTLNAPLTVSK